MPTDNPPLNILAISGSLKAGSVNTALLHAVAAFKRDNDIYNIYQDMEALPAFNPDKEAGNAAVMTFKQQIKSADGIVISTPEYAFGLPGVLKNALDWTVHSGDLNDKPVAVISASPLSTGGEKAMASLLLTLSALGTVTDSSMVLSIPEILKKTDTEKRLTDTGTITRMTQLFDNLVAAILKKKGMPA